MQGFLLCFAQRKALGACWFIYYMHTEIDL